jgi:serine/threonine protein kinase
MNLGTFLICGPEKTVKVSDFGLGKVINDLSTYESLTGTVGAQAYRAPEAYTNNYDTSCDIWSFGILTWEVWRVGRKFLENSENSPLLPLASDPNTWFEEDCEKAICRALDDLGRPRLMEIARCRNLALQETHHTFNELVKVERKNRPKFYELVGRILDFEDEI